jgi:hypothetical protein
MPPVNTFIGRAFKTATAWLSRLSTSIRSKKSRTQAMAPPPSHARLPADARGRGMRPTVKPHFRRRVATDMPTASLSSLPAIALRVAPPPRLYPATQPTKIDCEPAVQLSEAP